MKPATRRVSRPWFSEAMRHAAFDRRDGHDWVCTCVSCAAARAAGWVPPAYWPPLKKPATRPS